MRYALDGLAVLGTVLVFIVADNILPPAPWGRALQFVVYAIALYPLGFTWGWFPHRGRFLVGLIGGGAIVWVLEAWRTTLSREANTRAAWTVYTIVAAAVMIAAIRARMAAAPGQR